MEVYFFLFCFQNAKLTVIPVSTKISAQSVKVDFTYTLESALTIAQKGLEANNHTMEASIGEDLGDLRNIRADSISLRGSAAQNPASQEPEGFL